MEIHTTEKVVSMVGKLRHAVLNKKDACVVETSCSTTPPPSWRFELPSPSSSSASSSISSSYYNKNKDAVKVQELLSIVPTISARKLCAKLWEIQQYQPHTSIARMNNSATRLRRRPRRRRHQRENVVEVHKQLAQPQDTPSEQTGSATSFRRHVAESLVQHHRSSSHERKCCDSHRVSPASYSSSVEVAPYDSAETHTNSTDLKDMIGESSSYNLTTSKELLKVLNRIWSLEEQHDSNISAVEALRVELHRSQGQIKELLQEKQMNRHELENLMKQMTMEKLVRKNREHDRIEAAVRLINEELEDERKLRMRSENLHRKVAKELSQIKSSLSNCLTNLETERRARILLENLCDEFAKGIRDYEQEVHSLKWNSDKAQVNENGCDRLILHISEAWLDERIQMKLCQSSNDDLIDRSSIVDKLGFDIQRFLQAKRLAELKELKEIYPCQQSLDSADHTDFHESKSVYDGEGLDRQPFTMQINKSTDEVHQEKIEIQNSMMKRVLQSKEIFEDNEFQPRKVPQKSDNNRIGNSSLSSECCGDKVYPDECVCKEDYSSCVKSSPHSIDGNVSDPNKTAFIYPPNRGATIVPCAAVKENTLMAKLLEARLERHNKSGRPRSSKRTP